MLENLAYVRMNTMMMEKFITLGAQDLGPIDIDKISELPEYIDCKYDEENYPPNSNNENLYG